MDDRWWVPAAECRGSGLDFVPDSASRQELAVLRGHGARCPVRLECLRYGLAIHATGVWGGWLIPAHGRGRAVALRGARRELRAAAAAA